MREITQKTLVEVTVNSMMQKSWDFCPNNVQEYTLCKCFLHNTLFNYEENRR